MNAFMRRLCLTFGVAGVLGGLVLGVVWLKAPRAAPVSEATAPQAAVLVAARAIAPGALLRDGDLTWRPLDGGAPPSGAFLRGAVAQDAVVGSAARRGFAQGEILRADAVVRPDQRDFLAATLAPGQRAVTIPIDAQQSASGLVLPGDRVDVILVQEVAEGEHRMAAETVLRNARVLAVGRNFAPGKAASGLPDPIGLTAPKTITLEAPPHDAERLFVAARLGELQLALRGVGDLAAPQDTAPVWAGEVSDATRLRRGGAPPNGLAAALSAAPRLAAPLPAPAGKREPAVTVLRGVQSGTPS